MFSLPRATGYLPLPLSRSRPQNTDKNRRCLAKRRVKFFILLAALGVLALYLKGPRLPPLYREYRNREDHLPHYDPDTPFPNGGHANYIFFQNHQTGTGWGNVMQELLLFALMAYKLKRSFVFYNYQWSIHTTFTLYNGHLIPSTIPLSALVSGPLVGGPIEFKDVPRAVSENHFRQVCPKPTLVRREELREQLDGASPLQVFEAWAKKFGAMEDRCIEMPRGTPSAFEYMIFGTKDVLELWPALSESPIIKQFDWSPLIYSAFNANRRFFEPPSLSQHATVGEEEAKPTEPSPLFHRIPGLLVMHLRRGDYHAHCDLLASYSSEFSGFNQFDEFPDKFQVPQGENTTEKLAIYHQHCYPSISQIVAKVTDVRRKLPGLTRLYIMTNGKREWIDELIRALEQEPERWDAISSTRNLTLSWEQKFVSHGLDMLVAQRAQAFIGNGWSSLTSNTAMLRMAGKHEPNNTFFW